MRPAQVLVVDDAPTIRRFLEILLKQGGYAVDVAADVEASVKALDHKIYDLVIVDKNLDGEDGFTVCRAARERHEETACMVITADTSVTSAARAVEEQVAAYLLKPLRREPVLLRVQQVLDRQRLIRERQEARAELEKAKDALERRTVDLERTLDQLVNTQHRLTESEKQASIGMLAAGVAHEINNPACFILPNLDYLRRTTAKLAEQAIAAGADREVIAQSLGHSERMLERCQEGVNRIVEVVKTLNLFSRRSADEPTAVDINGLCRSLLDIVTHELEGQAQVDLELQDDLPRVSGHEEQLAQMVVDLLLNARRSVSASPRRTGHYIRVNTSAVDGQVVLTVHDSGPPLAEADDAASALDPFFGGGSLDDGPGLRLSLARDIVDRHGGELLLSATGDGNRLQARLPAMPSLAQSSSGSPR